MRTSKPNPRPKAAAKPKPKPAPPEPPPPLPQSWPFYSIHSGFRRQFSGSATTPYPGSVPSGPAKHQRPWQRGAPPLSRGPAPPGQPSPRRPGLHSSEATRRTEAVWKSVRHPAEPSRPLWRGGHDQGHPIWSPPGQDQVYDST